MAVDLTTSIGDVTFPGCIVNASGTATSFEELKAVANSGAAGIVMKTCTWNPRKGNEKPRYADFDCGSIQCMGLPNPGYLETLNYATALKAHNSAIKIIASIACPTPTDENTVKMLRKFADSSDTDLIEINISCPNLQEPAIGYSSKSTSVFLQKIRNLSPPLKKVMGLKLPPYTPEQKCQKMAELLNTYSDVIQFVSCSNSLPGYVLKDGEPLIKPKEGVGGIGGAYLKPLALLNVKTFYRHLKETFSIFGVGGIFSGRDTLDYILTGADGVQIGTCLYQEGTSCFKRITNELQEELKKQGYNSIKEAKGKKNSKVTS